MGLESLTFIAKEAPGFGVHGSQIKIIHEPSKFYEELLTRSSTSKNRVVLSALYLGTGDKEQQIVKALSENVSSPESNLRIRILLDHCRGTRDSGGSSSASLLAPLLNSQDGKDVQCEVAMYHTPHLRGLWKRLVPARWNETIGLQHCKVYIFDDSVIISGANLSDDYFSNRQDRYVLVENCPKLADFYEKLVSNISDFSLKMDKNQEFNLGDSFSTHPFLGPLKDFVSEAGDKVKTFLKQEQSSNSIDPSTMMSDNSIDPNTMMSDNASHDTWIFPSVQMGPFGVKHDSELTTNIFRSGLPGSSFMLGSGYFNPSQEYLSDILHRSKSTFNILMAHPEANGFYRAAGAAGGVAHAYTLIASMFWSLVCSRNMQHRVNMFEYQRKGWTFHAKGLWYYLPGEKLPSATMVGSPNFGYRSVEKDLETQITVVTKNEELRGNLHREQSRLFDEAKLVDSTTYAQPDRAVPRWVKAVVSLARHSF